MTLITPEYPPNLKNQLPTRWKIHKPPGTRGSKFFRRNRYAPPSNNTRAVLTDNQAPIRAQTNSQTLTGSNVSNNDRKATTVEGIAWGQEFMKNDYFACVGWESWALLGRVYSPYRHYVVLKDCALETRQKELDKKLKSMKDHTPVSRAASQLENLAHQVLKSVPKPTRHNLVPTSKFLYRIVARAESDEDIIKDWNSIMKYVMPQIAALEREPSVYEIEEMVENLRQETTEKSGFLITDEGINIKQIKHYVIAGDLGKGTYGDIKRGTYELTGKQVALKILLPSHGNAVKIEEEGRLLIGLHHPHVIQIYEVISRPDYVCMAVELCEQGTLHAMIAEKGKLSEMEARRIVYETALGLQYLHSQLVIHRDIKPENILLTATAQIKITDFGCAKKLTYKNEKCDKIVGTLLYAAPEIIELTYRGQPVDVWSLGATYYYMLLGRPPFFNQGEDIFEFLGRIRDEKLEIPEIISPEAEVLLTHLLEPTPFGRIQLDKFVTNCYFNQEKSVFDARVKVNVHSSEDQRQRFMDFAEETIELFLENVDDALSWEFFEQDAKQGINICTRKNAHCQFSVRTQGNIMFGGRILDRMWENIIVSHENRYLPVTVEHISEDIEIIYYAPNTLLEDVNVDMRFMSDFLYMQVRRRLPDGREVACIRSLDHPACPPQTNYVRAFITCAGFVLEPLSEDVNRCSYIHELDLNVMLPMDVLDMLNRSLIDIIPQVRKNLGVEKSAQIWKFL
eukprot:CFRG7010T1